MIIHADICSKAFKRKEFNKLAAKNGWGLHNFVGQLRLDAFNAEEVQMLTLLYKHVFSQEEPRGRLVIFDENGKPIAEHGPKEKPMLFLNKESA